MTNVYPFPSSITAEYIATHLSGDAKREGDDWLAPCPCHNDSDPSLRLKDGHSKNGRPNILITCFPCGTNGADGKDKRNAIIEELKKRELWPVYKAKPGRPKKTDDHDNYDWKVVDTYLYGEKIEGGHLYDEVKDIALRVERKEAFDVEGNPVRKDSGKIEKSFSQSHPDLANPGRWIWNTEGVTAPPYMIKEVREALAQGKVIVWCEGEKNVRFLRTKGFAATTTAQGSGFFNPAVVKYFAEYPDAVVAVLADNDEGGKGYARQVANELSLAGVKAKFLGVLEGIKEKGEDVIDWWEKYGGTSERLKGRINDAPLYRPKQTVLIEIGRISDLNREVQKVLAGTLYQWGKTIVRPDLVVLTDRHGEPITVPGFVQLNASQLFTHTHDYIDFEGPNKSGKIVPMDYPERYVNSLLNLGGGLKFGQLNAVITAPIVFPDGVVLQTPGYHAKYGLFYDPMGVEFPLIPEHPTREQALTALELLKEPIGLYPFKILEGETKEHNVSISVALSLFLTMTNRQAWPMVPGHAFSGNRPGVGKGKLVAVASIISYGTMPGVIKQGQKEEEFEKTLTALLQKGVVHVAIDNAYRPLKGDLLDQIVTETKVELRILGTGKIFTVLNNYTVTATGNNLVITDDAIRRWLLCQIESQSEAPENEAFKFNPLELTRQKRPELVTAVGTILKAYIMAGRPGKFVLGSFDEWSADVPSALVWLGEVNPMKSVEIVKANDPNIQGSADLLVILAKHLGKRMITINNLVKEARAVNDPSGGNIGELQNPALYDVLRSMNKDFNKELNPISLASKFGHMANAWRGGLRLHCIKDHNHPTVWGVEDKRAGDELFN